MFNEWTNAQLIRKLRDLTSNHPFDGGGGFLNGGNFAGLFRNWPKEKTAVFLLNSTIDESEVCSFSKRWW